MNAWREGRFRSTGNKRQQERHRDRDRARNNSTEARSSLGGSILRIRGIASANQDQQVRGLAEFNNGYVTSASTPNGTSSMDFHLRDSGTRGCDAAFVRRQPSAVQALEGDTTFDRRVGSACSAILDLSTKPVTVPESEAKKSLRPRTDLLKSRKGNLGAGLGTQLDVCRRRPMSPALGLTRLSAIYLHNVAVAKLAVAAPHEPRWSC